MAFTIRRNQKIPAIEKPHQLDIQLFWASMMGNFEGVDFKLVCARFLRSVLCLPLGKAHARPQRTARLPAIFGQNDDAAAVSGGRVVFEFLAGKDIDVSGDGRRLFKERVAQKPLEIFRLPGRSFIPSISFFPILLEQSQPRLIWGKERQAHSAVKRHFRKLGSLHDDRLSLPMLVPGQAVFLKTAEKPRPVLR